MNAVVLRSTNDLAVLDIPVPDIRPGWALVRVTHCGICGSDIRYAHGDNPWAKQTLGEHKPNPNNIILGHEVTGIVESVSQELEEDIIGKRVAILAFGTCGSCTHCRRGEEHLCENTRHLGHGAGWENLEFYYGGMAEYVPVEIGWLVPLPENVTNEAGVLLDPLGVAVHAVRKAKIEDGDTILIIGGGAVGQLAISVAKVLADVNVVLVDLCDSVLHIAQKIGADAAVNPTSTNPGEVVADISKGAGARAVIDTVGASLNKYLPLLARGGTYVTMTVTDEPQEFKTISLAGERCIVASCNFQLEDYYYGLELLQKGAIESSHIITHRFPLEQAIDAFWTAENKDKTGAVKVVLYNQPVAN